MNTTTEIQRFSLWQQLYMDFCRDSLLQVAGKAARSIHAFSDSLVEVCYNRAHV